jgi:hypothetical protein
LGQRRISFRLRRLAEGWVSVTHLQLDLTAYPTLHLLKIGNLPKGTVS